MHFDNILTNRSTALEKIIQRLKSSGNQESTISELVSFGDITFFCQFFGLTIFEFVRAISWSPAFADMKIVVIALCHLRREAVIRRRKKTA